MEGIAIEAKFSSVEESSYLAYKSSKEHIDHDDYFNEFDKIGGDDASSDEGAKGVGPQTPNFD